MSRASPILRWLDDETFYSICSRQHRYLSHLDTNSTLGWLYGNEYRTISHDFPSNFNSINSLVSATWGDALSIIFEHTIFTFFCPFQKELRIEDAVLVLKGPHLGSLKYRLGLLTGRFGAEHPLKACITCMEEDQASQGAAYWHLTHQYPGVILCPIHGTLLSVSEVNRQRSGVFEWTLPCSNQLHPCAPQTPTVASNKALSNLQISIVDLLKHRSMHFDPEITRQTYKAALNTLGWPGDGDIAAIESFAAFASLLQPFSPFTSLPTTSAGVRAFLHSMTRKPRGHCHPLKHLVLVNWLYSGFGQFVEQYKLSDCAQRQTDGTQPIEYTTQLSPEKLQSKAIVSTNKLKPKKLKPPMRKIILDELRNGICKCEICLKFSISISTVNRVLRSVPATTKIRKDKLFENSINNHRKAWLNTILNNPTLSTKLLRKITPASYFWLYRYDRDWLFLQNGKLPTGRLGNKRHVNWEERDRKLSELVRITINHLPTVSEAKNYSICELCDLIPGLARALESPRRFPITKAAITSSSLFAGTSSKG